MTSHTSEIVTGCHTKHSRASAPRKAPTQGAKAWKPQISSEPRGFCRSYCSKHGVIWEILTMLQQSKLCISVPSCALSCFSAGLVLPQPGEPQGQQLHYPRRSSCSCTGTTGIFLCLPKFFPSSLLPLEESLGFQGKCNLPYLKSCLISSYLLPFPPAHWKGPWVHKLGSALNRAARTVSGDLVGSACC